MRAITSSQLDDFIYEVTGKRLRGYQEEAVGTAENAWIAGTVEKLRMCLYFKTGAGKSLTAMASLYAAGERTALVIAPPATHQEWQELGEAFGIETECISHEKFRRADYLPSRYKAIIGDEWHKLGGYKGQGWKKMDRLAPRLEAPLIACSATPSYNDVERVYCVAHVLDPVNHKGGYLEFLNRHCITTVSQFSRTPDVVGLRNFSGETAAADFLASLPYVFYVEDDSVYEIVDVSRPAWTPGEFQTLGLDRARMRIMASDIERRHLERVRALCEWDKQSQSHVIRDDVYDWLTIEAGNATGPLLVYCNHSEVADALGKKLLANNVKYAVITGAMTKKEKTAKLNEFRNGWLDILVGTASIATGTDGLDKVCDHLIILDDTDDDSLRRQLIGRILHRGEGQGPRKKSIKRLVFS